MKCTHLSAYCNGSGDVVIRAEQRHHMAELTKLKHLGKKQYMHYKVYCTQCSARAYWKMMKESCSRVKEKYPYQTISTFTAR